jgi:hypothetical protein
MAIYHPDTNRRRGGDPVHEELEYLASKVGTLERDLPFRRRRDARNNVLSTAAIAVLDVAAILGARAVAQSANVDLVSWRIGLFAAFAVAATLVTVAAFAARGTVRSLLSYVVEAAAKPAPRITPRENMITALLASLVIVGLYVDGWRHINLADNRAGAFLTWWHLPLYIGATLTGLWITTRNQSIRELVRGRFDIAAVPAGYRLGVVGMGLLTAGAAGDAVWHTFYGIEQGIERTMSPFHIALFTAAALILGSPLRAAWANGGPVAPGFRRFFPALLSLTLCTAAISFIVQFLLPFLLWTKPVPDIAAIGDAAENTRIVGLATILTANLMLMTPVLFAMRRWRLPFGSVTFLFTTVSVLESGMVDMKRGFAVLSAVVAGLTADLLIARVRATPERAGAQRIVAGVTPLVFWTLYFGILRYGYGIVWERNVWLSAILLAGLSGILMSSLIAPAQPAVAAADVELHEAGAGDAGERLAA